MDKSCKNCVHFDETLILGEKCKGYCKELQMSISISDKTCDRYKSATDITMGNYNLYAITTKNNNKANKTVGIVNSESSANMIKKALNINTDYGDTINCGTAKIFSIDKFSKHDINSLHKLSNDITEILIIIRMLSAQITEMRGNNIHNIPEYMLEGYIEDYIKWLKQDMTNFKIKLDKLIENKCKEKSKQSEKNFDEILKFVNEKTTELAEVLNDRILKEINEESKNFCKHCKYYKDFNAESGNGHCSKISRTVNIKDTGCENFSSYYVK